MVQLSSPKPEIIPVRTGDKKIRTLNRTDQTHSSEKSKFQESLEKEKSAGKKDVSEKSAVSKKTTAAEPNQEHAEKKSVSKKIVERNNLPVKDLKSQIPVQSDLQELLKVKLDAVSGKNHKSDTVIRAKKSAVLKKDSSAEASLVQAASAVDSKSAVTTLSDPVKGGPENLLNKDASVESVASSPNKDMVDGLVQVIENVEAVIEGAEENLAANLNSRNNSTGKKKNLSDRSIRNTARSSESPKISVEDRRTVKTDDARAVFAAAEKQGNEDLTLEMAPQDDLTGTAVMVEAKDSTTQFVLNSAEEQKGSFLLNKQLQEGGSKELAKNIRFVLKDQNQGEIKLILKPEALGKVRIQLNLQENNIVGKIFVENNSVKQVFLNNLSDLTKALEDSGFQTSSLDVQVGGGETGSQNQHRDEQPVYFQRDLSEVDEQIPLVYDESPSLSQIDLVI